MSVEWFLKLKEMDSLTKMRHNSLKVKAEEEERLSKLENRRQETQSQSVSLRQELMAIQDLMADLEARIKTSSQQKERLMDTGGDDKKITHYANEISQLEEQGFDLLNQIEEKETALQENKTFLAGLEKTIHEIAQEVNTRVAELNQEIQITEMRINSLMEELPDDFKNALKKISAKNPIHGPFTRVDQGSCFFCRYQISRVEESEIDMQKGLKTCRQCGRIFLPYGA